MQFRNEVHANAYNVIHVLLVFNEIDMICTCIVYHQVYHLGVCERCKRRMSEENLSPQQLFLIHVKAVLGHIKNTHPTITSIMWDDMLRHTELPILMSKCFVIILF